MYKATAWSTICNSYWNPQSVHGETMLGVAAGRPKPKRPWKITNLHALYMGPVGDHTTRLWYVLLQRDAPKLSSLRSLKSHAVLQMNTTYLTLTTVFVPQFIAAAAERTPTCLQLH